MTLTLTTHFLTFRSRQGAARLRRCVGSVLTAVTVAATLVFAAAGPANAQAYAGDASTKPLGSGLAAAITETAAVLRGAEALAFTYQKVEWLVEAPPPATVQASTEQMLLPDESDRRRLVEALGSETVLLLWCQGAGIIASTTGGTTNDFMATISDDATSGCAGTGGGMLVAQGQMAVLSCVDTRVLAPTPTSAFIPGGSVVSAAVGGVGADAGDPGAIIVGPSTGGANDTSGASWCPEPTGGVAEAQGATTPVVFVCPTSDVIASSTGGVSSDLWDSGADGSDTLRCPGTAQRLEELVSATSGADPLAGMRSMLHAYEDSMGHDDELSSLTSIVRLLDTAPELRELASELGRLRLDGELDVEILASASGGARGWADLNDLELRSVLRQVEVLSVQLDDWYSGVAASPNQFTVEIEGVSAAWRPWLDARSTDPRLFDEADALFGKRTGSAEPSAARPSDPDATDSERGTEPTTPPASRPTSTTVPRSTTTTVPPRATTTTTPPRPTTTTSPRPTTTTTPRPTTTTTPRPTTTPRATTTTAPRPTTTVPDRPAATTVPERPTNTAGR